MSERFDYQNMDVKLYLALKSVLNPLNSNVQANIAEDQAKLVMQEFEQSQGALPDWAVARNWGYDLLPGAQLCTRDGRRTGNAYIISKENKDYAGLAGFVEVYHCLTDAGSRFAFTEPEILEAFTIGDWICEPIRILRDFDRNGEFKPEPK